jgi:enamine deaminase RidA (YjgF/YER057c/UK114 family)
MTPSERLAELKITLPPVTAPIGSYIPGIRTGRFVLVSGQLPFQDGKLTAVGRVPGDVPLEQARLAARQSGLNALAIAAHTAGGIDRIARVVRLGVFVNSGPGFVDQPAVANGASDLMVEIFGEAGRHVRAAVGANELPRNAAVEVEMMVELKADGGETGD